MVIEAEELELIDDAGNLLRELLQQALAIRLRSRWRASGACRSLAFRYGARLFVGLPQRGDLTHRIALGEGALAPCSNSDASQDKYGG